MNFIIENSFYDASDPQNKHDFLQDPEKITGAFLFNFLGTLAAIDLLKNKPDHQDKFFRHLKQDKKLRLANITDENLDISLAVKLAFDAGYFKKKETVDQITRFLVKLKTGSIKSINSEIVREWAKDLTPKYRKDLDPKVRIIFKKFADDDIPLSDIVLPLQKYAKKLSYAGEFKLISKKVTYPKPDKLDAVDAKVIDDVGKNQDDDVPDTTDAIPQDTPDGPDTIVTPIAEPKAEPIPQNYQELIDNIDLSKYSINDFKESRVQHMLSNMVNNVFGGYQRMSGHVIIDYLQTAINIKYPDVTDGYIGEFKKTINNYFYLQSFQFQDLDLMKNTADSGVEKSEILRIVEVYKAIYNDLSEFNKKEIKKVISIDASIKGYLNKLQYAFWNAAIYGNVNEFAGDLISDISRNLRSIWHRVYVQTLYLYYTPQHTETINFYKKKSFVKQFEDPKLKEYLDSVFEAKEPSVEPSDFIIELLAGNMEYLRNHFMNLSSGRSDIYNIDAVYDPNHNHRTAVIVNDQFTRALFDGSFFGKLDIPKIKKGMIPHFKDFVNGKTEYSYATGKKPIVSILLGTEIDYPSYIPNIQEIRSIFADILDKLKDELLDEFKSNSLKYLKMNDDYAASKATLVIIDIVSPNNYKISHTSIPDGSSESDILISYVKTKKTSRIKLTVDAAKRLNLHKYGNFDVFDTAADYDLNKPNLESFMKARQMVDDDTNGIRRFLDEYADIKLWNTISADNQAKFIKDVIDAELSADYGSHFIKKAFSSNSWQYNNMRAAIPNLKVEDKKEIIEKLSSNTEALQNVPKDFMGYGSKNRRANWMRFVNDTLPDLIDEHPELVDKFLDGLDDNYTKYQLRNNITGQDIVSVIIRDSEINPFEKLTSQRVKQLLKYNEIDYNKVMDESGLKIRKKKNETLAQYLIRSKKEAESNKAKTFTSLPQLAVVNVEATKEDNAKKAVEIERTDNGRHGNFKIKVLKQFDVHLPDEEFTAYKKMVEDDPNANQRITPAFHGSGGVAANMILRKGFTVIPTGDSSTVGRMLGDGIYFSNVINKVAQYVGNNGFGRRFGTKGYIFDMKAILGPLGKNPGHRSAGVNGVGTRSPEWCVKDHKKQLKIMRAYEVELISNQEFDQIRSIAASVQEDSKPLSFKSYNENIANPSSGNQSYKIYTFMDGKIPVIEEGAVVDAITIEQARDRDLYFGVIYDVSANGANIMIPTEPDQDEQIDVLATSYIETDKMEQLVNDLSPFNK